MQTAVVTGGARGLGRSIARRLADRGYAVLITDIDELAAAEAARDIDGDAWSLHQDVRDCESHDRVARAASERGELAVWVNNAGVLETGTTWELSEDAIRRQVDINVLGVIWGCHAAARAMERGHIINIASLAALVPTPGLAVYAASKHAVLGFSLALTGELDRARRPIKVSAVCPDVIETDMVKRVAGDENASILFRSRSLLTPETVAEFTVDLLDRPRPTAVYPRHQGVLAHLFRPFPRLGLRVLDQMRKIGDRNRRRRS